MENYYGRSNGKLFTHLVEYLCVSFSIAMFLTSVSILADLATPSSNNKEKTKTNQVEALLLLN